jgi:phosphatidylglycerophosphate synthase
MENKYFKAVNIMYPIDKAEDEKIINPFMFYILRPLSFRASYILTRLKVSASSVSIFSFFVVLIGGILLFYTPLVAASFIFFYQYLDVIDGNIARLTKTTSKYGSFLDETIITFAGAYIPIMVGFAVFLNDSNAYFGIGSIVLGVSISISRLVRRIMTDNINSLKGVVDRNNIAGECRSFTSKIAVMLN